MKESIIALLMILPWFIVVYLCNNGKNITVETIKMCFRQGSHPQRRWLLKNIVEAVENEYTEDNWYNRFSWLVEEILLSDDLVGKFEIDKECVIRGLRVAVHDAIEYKKRNK